MFCSKIPKESNRILTALGLKLCHSLQFCKYSLRRHISNDMWSVIAINLFFLYFRIAISAWVEIPQVPSQSPEPPNFANTRPAQFVFGTPKVSFINPKTTTTTPSYRTVSTTPQMPVENFNYKNVMTSTVSPLTTPRMNPRIKDRKDEYQPKPKRPEQNSTRSESENNTKTPKSDDSYPGIMPLLQSIQETLTINAKKSLKSKISLLTKLKDNLLTNIDYRMSSLWKKSDEPTQARGHDDHEMEFPSNEGALMTIGFLTFAVFLIKLVLKLIHALKYKQNTMVMTTVAPAAAFIGRKKRQLEDDLKILKYIDEYKFN